MLLLLWRHWYLVCFEMAYIVLSTLMSFVFIVSIAGTLLAVLSLSLSLSLSLGYGQLYQGGAARYTYSIRPPNYLRDCTVPEVVQVGRC